MTEINTAAEADETADHAAGPAELLPIPEAEASRPLRDWKRRYRRLWRTIRRPMRRDHGDFQAPLHTWRHNDGRTIVLIGMFHTADPAFYTHVLQRIETWELKGANVYHEQVKTPATPEEFTALSLPERQTLRLLLETQMRQTEMTHSVGMVTQAEAFPLGDGWTRADVDVRDELPLFGCQKMILMIQKQLRHRLELPRTDAQRARKRRLLRMTPWLSRLSLVGDRDQLMDLRIARDHRDILATQALLSAPADVPAVGVWGASHLPGIGLYLWRAGFELRDIEWITVVAKRPERAAVQ